jgi:hypothetical protein
VGNISSHFALAWEILHQLEIANDSRALSPSEVWFRNNLKSIALPLLLSNG